MKFRLAFACLLIMLMLLVSACGPAAAPQPPATSDSEVAEAVVATEIPATHTAVPATNTPETAPSTATTVVQEMTAVPTDTAVPPTETPVPDWLNTFSRDSNNLAVLGNPDAPVTLTDYSDFM